MSNDIVEGPRTGPCGRVHESEGEQFECYDCEYEVLHRDMAESMYEQAAWEAESLRDNAMYDAYMDRGYDYGGYLAWKAGETPPLIDRRRSIYDDWREYRKQHQPEQGVT